MPKRSLMLAGGGLKIPFQAGVLQVWLDEAGVQFDHGDGVSAACFNLAMWAQGMTGAAIANNWRAYRPLAAVRVNWGALRIFHAPSLLTLDAFRRTIFRRWGIDFDVIRNARREATFNVYNFSTHELRPVPASELTEDFLIAASSLPIWFPPVVIDGETYIDAVFNVDANLEEAIRRGADELWVVFTASRLGQWKPGIGNGFFGIFEATTNGGYNRMRQRIEVNNAAIARGVPGEFGRTITVRELSAEVPLHYLLNFSRRRIAAAVELGVSAAREWCASHL